MSVTDWIKINKLEPNNGQIPGIQKNPRFLRKEKFAQLILSLLEFPQMTEVRPIAYASHEGKNVVLGGNQRLRTFSEILKMGYDEAEKVLFNSDEYAKKDNDLQLLILKWWKTFFETHKVPAMDITRLSIEQKREFVIKDNVQHGQDDWDLLSNEWDDEQLTNWGMDLPTSYDPEPEEEYTAEPRPDTGIIAFALNDDERKQWDTAKEIIGYKTDKTAFLEMIEALIDENTIKDE